MELPAFSTKGWIFLHIIFHSAPLSKVTVVSIKEKYLIVDRLSAAYVGELGHGFESPVSIHITRWCVDILGVLLGLVHNCG